MEKHTLKKLHDTEIEILDEIVRICNKHNLVYFLYGGTLLGAVRHKGFIPWDDDLDIAMPRNDYEKFLEIAQNELRSKFIIDNYKTNKEYYLNFTKIRNQNTEFIQSFQNEQYNGPNGIWVDIFPLDNAKKEEDIIQTIRVKIIKLLRSIAHYRLGFFLNKKYFLIKKLLGLIAKIVPLNAMIKFQDNLMKKQQKIHTGYFISIASQYDFRKQTMKKEIFLPAKELEFEGSLYKVPNDYKSFLERIYGDYMQLPPEEKRVTHNPIKLVFERE